MNSSRESFILEQSLCFFVVYNHCLANQCSCWLLLVPHPRQHYPVYLSKYPICTLLCPFRFDFVTEPSTQGAFLRPVQGKFRRVPDQKAVTELAYASSVTKIKQPEAVPSVEDGILPMDANLKVALQSLHRQLDGPQKSIASGPYNIEEGLEENDRLEAPHIGINAVLPPHPTKVKQPRENDKTHGGGQASGSGSTSGRQKSISAKASGSNQTDDLLLQPSMSGSNGSKQPEIINPSARDLELEMRLPNMPVSVA